MKAKSYVIIGFLFLLPFKGSAFELSGMVTPKSLSEIWSKHILPLILLDKNCSQNIEDWFDYSGKSFEQLQEDLPSQAEILTPLEMKVPGDGNYLAVDEKFHKYITIPHAGADEEAKVCADLAKDALAARWLMNLKNMFKVLLKYQREAIAAAKIDYNNGNSSNTSALKNAIEMQCGVLKEYQRTSTSELELLVSRCIKTLYKRATVNSKDVEDFVCQHMGKAICVIARRASRRGY